jgi:hypothetical protein
MSIAVLCSAGQVFVALSYRWAELSTATALDVLAGSSAGIKQLVGCAIYLAGCIPLTIMKAQQGDKCSEAALPIAAVEAARQLESRSI